MCTYFHSLIITYSCLCKLNNIDIYYMYKRQHIIKSNDRKNTCYYIKIFEISLKYYENELINEVGMPKITY